MTAKPHPSSSPDAEALAADNARLRKELVSVKASLTLANQKLDTALRDSRDFVRLALSAVSGVGVWTYEVASDRFFIDAAIAELYAVDAVQGAAGIKRVHFLANVHQDDLAALRATMSGGLVRSGDLALEYRIVHPDGSIRWVLSIGHTYFDADGTPRRRTGVGIEMTKQRLLEQQLRQSQKMEAVGQLTGGLAHDFNNMLAGISGNLDLLRIRLSQGRVEDLGRYIDSALRSSKRAAALTHRLLAFSRRQPLAPTPTDVNRLVAGMEELISRTAGPLIVTSVESAVDVWPTLVDSNQLESALLNLCINARDAMPEGGSIRISTANVVLDEAAACRLELIGGEYVSLSVEDTGHGMTADVMAHAFEPFFTTKPMGQGTGLGLSMIYGFAQQSGGQVHIASQVSHGTTMSIYLPRHLPQEDVALDAADPAVALMTSRGGTVMVVDDDAVLRAVMVEVMTDLGYKTFEAADGAAALVILQNETNHIDLLLTDVGLPGGINGRQAADAARILRPDLKILFVTGYAESFGVGADVLDPGMFMLTKPFAVTDLVAVVTHLMAPG